MTDVRNPDVLRVSEAKYRSINRFIGVLGLAIGVAMFAVAYVCLVIGPPLTSGAILASLLGVGAVGVGVMTLLIAARFPHVSGFARVVNASIYVVVGLAALGVFLVAVLSPDGALAGLLLGAVMAFNLVMLARYNGLVLRTAAALIAPPT